MINYFCKKPLWECSKDLAKVAIGNAFADLVIENANLVNVCTEEIIPSVSVAVACGRIARIGDCKDIIGKDTIVIDAKGKYLAPAFLDAHMHLESSMLTFSEYAKAVIPHGTSGVFYDPHEICNVLGVKGVKLLVEESKVTPLKAMLTFPSCVPAVEGFEDNGAKITEKDIKKVMKWKETVALGEMMNFPGIINSQDAPHRIVGEALKAGKTVQGHYSVLETEKGLNAYACSGVRNCHESVRAEDALAKMRMGIYAFMREGSAWRDLTEVIKAVTEKKVDISYCCLVTDDSHPNTLLKNGHLDHIVKMAVNAGVPFTSAIRMVSLNVAKCHNLDGDLGSIAPSKCADMVLIDSPENCHVTDVFIDGNHLVKDGKLQVDIPKFEYPKKAKHSVKLNEKTEKDFKIYCDKDKVKIRAIKITPEKTITTEEIVELEAHNGELKSNVEKDLLKCFVFDRHHKNGKYAYGFVKGFGIKSGALAQTVSHDAHNMQVVGTSDSDMALAVNLLTACGGGLIAVKDGKVLGHVPLSIAGLISEKSLEETSDLLKNIERAWEEMGSNVPSPFMTMALIPLAVIPNIRLTNRGIVDCNEFKFVPLIVE